MIRPARADETDAIIDVLRQSIGGHHDPTRLMAWITDPNRRIWVDAQIRGAIVVQIAGDEAEVIDIAVAPQHRRQGIGAALAGFALDHLQCCGVSVVFLEVRASNIPAIALYRRLGFSDAGTRPGYYRNGDDALLLRWDAPC